MVMDSKSLPTAAEEETGSIKHQRCGAITKSGQPCGGRPSESGTCFAHDPALSATREAARVRGGKNSSSRARLEKLMPERLGPTFELLEKAVTEVYEGRLPAQRASAMASLTGALIKIIKAGEKADGDFSPRIQFVSPDPDKFYADLRARRRLRPPLAGDPPSEETDGVLAELDKFDQEYGTDIKLPELWI